MHPTVRLLSSCLWSLLLLVLGASPARALDPNLPPGGNFDLSHWYLGLPVDDQGGTSGDSKSISTVELLNGYSNALYFYTDTDGSMVCWAPVDGATTPGSSYPRSELRELISPPSTLINWSGYGLHLLEAQCRVTQVPSTKKVIIGQIHSKTGNARPLVKLLYDDGQIRGLVKQSPNADPDTNFNFQNVGLSNLVDYTIRMEDGLVTMTVNGSSQQMDVFASDPDWANQEFYFKAGSYCQDNSGPSSEGARVAFYSLTASHPETNTPPSVTVTNVIVDDTFADGHRARTGALDADWWSSSSTSGNSIEVYTGQLGLVSGTAGRGIHGTFAPQTLGVGESLIATMTFTTPATVSAGPSSTAFKVALMDLNDAGLAADLSSSSSSVNPLYTNLPGYLAGMDIGTGTEDIDFRKHNVPNATGRFLGTTEEWTAMGNSANDGYTFAALTEYVLSYAITRTAADSLLLSFSLSDAGGVIASHIETDPSAIANHFGLLGIWANSNIFGSTTTKGASEDNGITFSHIRIETVTLSPVAPSLAIARSGTNVVLWWPTNSTAGFALEATPGMDAPSWSPAGASTIVGGVHQVAIPATNSGSYYRLNKP